MVSPRTQVPIRIGVLTPSSNTVLEPITTEMVAAHGNASAHFSRFKVTEIALSAAALKQFEDAGMLRAAELLADANVDVIAWSGTSAAWLGFDSDERLCERITSATGVKACTSVLAFRDVFSKTGITNIGLVTPYTADVQARIVTHWGSGGLHCSAERHIGLQANFAFSDVPERQVANLVREVAQQGCEAVAIVCTNLRAARIAPVLEQELGIPVYDSVAVTVWASLRLAGGDLARLKCWGSLFRNQLLVAAA